MAAQRSHLESGTGCRWLMPAAEMAGLANGRWRPSPDPALARWAWLPRTATRALGADPGSGPVRHAADTAYPGPVPEQARPRPVPEPDNLAQPASVNDPSPGGPWQDHRVLACGPHPQVTCG